MGVRSCRRFVDAAGQTWYEVPGYGLVTWTVEQITEQARYLAGLHRPDRARLTWRFLPVVGWPGRCCKFCQTAWPCRARSWSVSWLDELAMEQHTRHSR
ncbi:MAG TPA: hypothetical protein VGP31_19210 [Planosporangium sp.]|jgi:hypothetical protein|nr:hypothetical protein [Planosporangium sp.]